MRQIIKIANKNININTNVNLIYKSIIKYCDGYMDQSKDSDKIDLTINIIFDLNLYNNYKIQHLCKKNYYKNGFMTLFHRNMIIVINAKKNYIYVILKEINDENNELINRILVNYLLKLLEKDNVFFIEAVCIAKENYSIAFIGEKDFIKDLMYELLKNGYEYVSTHKIGLKIKENTIKVYNLPEKSKMRYEYSNKINTNTILKKIIILERNMSNNEIKLEQEKRNNFITILNDKHIILKEDCISYFNRIYKTKDTSIDDNYIYDNIKNLKIIYKIKDLNKIYNIIATSI